MPRNTVWKVTCFSDNTKSVTFELRARLNVAVAVEIVDLLASSVELNGQDGLVCHSFKCTVLKENTEQLKMVI